MLLPVALGQAEPPGPRLARLQAQLAHEGPHQLRPDGTPQATKSACTRRYPYVSSGTSNDLLTISAMLRAFSPSPIPARSVIEKPERDTSIHRHIVTINGTSHHQIPGKPHTPRR